MLQVLSLYLFEKFVFCTDNCSGQNKNWFLYTLLVNEANRISGTVNESVIKYFEPGHTSMSTDSFHHKVWQGMKKKKRVEDFEDLVDLVKACGKSFVMDYKSFWLVPPGVSQGKYTREKPICCCFAVLLCFAVCFAVLWFDVRLTNLMLKLWLNLTSVLLYMLSL